MGSIGSQARNLPAHLLWPGTSSALQFGARRVTASNHPFFFLIIICFPIKATDSFTDHTSRSKTYTTQKLLQRCFVCHDLITLLFYLYFFRIFFSLSFSKCFRSFTSSCPFFHPFYNLFLVTNSPSFTQILTFSTLLLFMKPSKNWWLCLTLWNEWDGTSIAMDIKNPNVSCTHSYMRRNHRNKIIHILFINAG